GGMHQGRSNYPKFQIHEKVLSTTEMVCGPWKLSGSRKKDRVFSAFCLRLRAGYVQRAETIRLSSLDNPEKKIVSDRESTISPAIANSRDYSRRNQKASAVLKIWRRDPFVAVRTRIQPQNPHYVLSPSSELMQQVEIVDGASHLKCKKT